MKIMMSLGILVALISLTFVTALPIGPETITPISSERWLSWNAQSQAALAGNVSQLDFSGSTITRTWQGYFGNITGMIVLGDALNNTLYDWTVSSPQGEIYAVRNAAVPTWTSARCANQTELQAEDVTLGVNLSVDEDAVNRTFLVGTSHPLFYVANQTIVNNTCPAVGLYNSSGVPSDYFREVMLSDGTANMIYTGIIAHTLNPFAESDGFDGSTHDFQMIVGENGHGNDVAVSTYWFYLELE